MILLLEGVKVLYSCVVAITELTAGFTLLLIFLGIGVTLRSSKSVCGTFLTPSTSSFAAGAGAPSITIASGTVTLICDVVAVWPNLRPHTAMSTFSVVNVAGVKIRSIAVSAGSAVQAFFFTGGSSQYRFWLVAWKMRTGESCCQNSVRIGREFRQPYASPGFAG